MATEPDDHSTLREHFAWTYGTLAMVHAVIVDGGTRYKPLHFIIRGSGGRNEPRRETSSPYAATVAVGRLDRLPGALAASNKALRLLLSTPRAQAPTRGGMSRRLSGCDRDRRGAEDSPMRHSLTRESGIGARQMSRAHVVRTIGGASWR